MKLYKTSIIIWSEYDPAELELTDLAHRAETGDAYCSTMGCALISEPEKDPTWDGTDFFDAEDGVDLSSGATLGDPTGADLSRDAARQGTNAKPNCVSEAASEPSEQEVMRLFNSILLLGRVLATRQSLYRFIDLLTSSCDGTCRRVTDEGILVLKVAQHLAMAEPPAGQPEAEPQAVLARSVVRLDPDLM